MKFNSTSFILAILLLVSGVSHSQQWGDYTLYSLQNSSNAYLIDTNSNVVKTWTFASTAKTGYSTYMLPGGSLIRTVARTGNSFTGGPICGEVQKVDYSGAVIWDYVYSTTNYCTHHDICPMPNGNVLLIAYERKTATEVTAAGCSQSIEMWPDKIVEVQPTGATTGTVVWEWHAWDHLVQNVNPTKANYQTSISDHPELLNINYNTQKDWMHMNGVDYNPILDQISFSSHNLSEWFIIDHSTTTAEAASHSGGNSGKGGDLLFRWGHPTNYSTTGTSILNVTHDAHWIPEGIPNAGYLVGFNNKGVSNSQSAVDQIIPPRVGYNYTKVAGSAYAPSTYTLRHACSGYSSNMGNSQQLPNGNMLVCMATLGLIYETNPAGTTIWSKSLTGACPQAFRYDTCYVNNPAPSIPVISQNGTQLESTVDATYQWYFNGDLLPGETNQTITPTQSGIYLVRTTNTTSCSYSYSKGFSFTITGLSQVEQAYANIGVYPNPSKGLIHISGAEKLESGYTIMMADALGKVIFAGNNADLIDASSFGNGIYYVSIQAKGEKAITKKVVLIK
jgi:Arylsulfotransferase (ASST)/Secretion system C-terminal sorting domain